jgi:nicotinamidase-related amidase
LIAKIAEDLILPIDIRSYKDNARIPLLVLVDLQQEYVCPGRPLGLKNAGKAFDNCKRLLACARANRYPVAFVRWTQAGLMFNRGAQFSDWVDGCVPTGSDMIFERAWPSCYASAEFSEMMDSGGGRNAVIAGFTGSIACLATIIEGAPRQHRFTFIHDASISHAHHGKEEDEIHAMATTLISLYATVWTTEHWLNEQASRDPQDSQGLCSDHALG